MASITKLPEDCISLIISFTSPRDACRSSSVCHLFKAASEYDVVWEKFLPSDYQNLISQSQSLEFTQQVLNSMSKKDLYFHLCHRPIIIADGRMSLSLDRESGKKCFMIGARGLSITWGETPEYWIWNSLPQSRFSEVAILKYVWWLHVAANVETRILSSETTYMAYLVYNLTENGQPFRGRPVSLHVHFEGRVGGEVLSAYLGNNAAIAEGTGNMPLPRNRSDGWMEIEMGEFLTGHGDDGSISCNLREVSCSRVWSGLVVEGIEFRPRVGM